MQGTLAAVVHAAGTLGASARAYGARLDVPVDPSADQARRWLEDELLDPAYHVQPSLLERLLQWIQEQIAKAGDAVSQVNPLYASIVVLTVLAIIAGLALLVTGPVRRSRTAARMSNDVLGDDTRTAAQLRAAAEAHAAAGRWGPAVLDRFRAILRSLEERVVLDERPGRTADEASYAASVRFPQQAAELVAAGRLFDEVCYGDVLPGEADDRRLRELDAVLTRTRPTRQTRPGVSDDDDDETVDLLDPLAADGVRDASGAAR